MWTSSLSKAVPVLAAVAAFLASPALGQEKNAATAAPRATFTETRHEAGTVNEGAVVAHEFELTNEGNGPLRIAELVPA